MKGNVSEPLYREKFCFELFPPANFICFTDLVKTQTGDVDNVQKIVPCKHC